MILLAPMEGLLDFVLRDILTRAGGIDRCVSEFIRITDQLLPERVFTRIVPELRHGGRTPAGVPVRAQLLGSDPACMADNAARLAGLGPAGIDLNFGCPAKVINRHGGGAICSTSLKHCMPSWRRCAAQCQRACRCRPRCGWAWTTTPAPWNALRPWPAPAPPSWWCMPAPRPRPTARPPTGRAWPTSGSQRLGCNHGVCGVVGVVAAQLDTRARLDSGAHDRRQLEPHKMHGRGLFVVLAVQVFVGNGVHAGWPFHLDEHAVFHADQARQLALALVHVGVFDQHGGLPVAAVGHQRRIGVDLLLMPSSSKIFSMRSIS
jgi:hypothetical protein